MPKKMKRMKIKNEDTSKEELVDIFENVNSVYEVDIIVTDTKTGKKQNKTVSIVDIDIDIDINLRVSNDLNKIYSTDNMTIEVAGYYFDFVSRDGNFDSSKIIMNKNRTHRKEERYYIDYYETM